MNMENTGINVRLVSLQPNQRLRFLRLGAGEPLTALLGNLFGNFAEPVLVRVLAVVPPPVLLRFFATRRGGTCLTVGSVVGRFVIVIGTIGLGVAWPRLVRIISERPLNPFNTVAR